jgi:hypothetical protein
MIGAAMTALASSSRALEMTWKEYFILLRIPEKEIFVVRQRVVVMIEASCCCDWNPKCEVRVGFLSCKDAIL